MRIYNVVSWLSDVYTRFSIRKRSLHKVQTDQHWIRHCFYMIVLNLNNILFHQQTLALKKETLHKGSYIWSRLTLNTIPLVCQIIKHCTVWCFDVVVVVVVFTAAVVVTVVAVVAAIVVSLLLLSLLLLLLLLLFIYKQLKLCFCDYHLCRVVSRTCTPWWS